MSDGESRELALFAGAGGGILGGILCGFKTVCAVEKDQFCRQVLLRRQIDGVLPLFPIWDDIGSFDGGPWRGLVDVITAGFPCQPFSVAGKKLGEYDSRNLWPDTIRVIRDVGPGFVFLENVPGLLTSGYFGRILGDLAEAGLDVGWLCLSAADVGARHRRQRLWICGVADADNLGREEQRGGGSVSAKYARAERCGWWAAEPLLGRVADGMANRVDRLTAIGNGQVPRVAQEAWLRLTAEKDRR